MALFICELGRPVLDLPRAPLVMGGGMPEALRLPWWHGWRGRHWTALNGFAWMGARLNDRVMRAGGAICVRVLLRCWDFADSSVDDGRWAYSQEPWEELPMMRRLWLAGVGGLMGSWDEGRCLGCPDLADSAGARSWVQGDGCSCVTCPHARGCG